MGIKWYNFLDWQNINVSDKSVKMFLELQLRHFQSSMKKELHDVSKCYCKLKYKTECFMFKSSIVRAVLCCALWLFEVIYFFCICGWASNCSALFLGFRSVCSYTPSRRCWIWWYQQWNLSRWAISHGRGVLSFCCFLQSHYTVFVLN